MIKKIYYSIFFFASIVLTNSLQAMLINTALGPAGQASAIVAQDDGKIIVIGTNNTLTEILAVRYKPDLTVDDTYGLHGLTKKDGLNIAQVNNAIIDSQGRLVIAGVNLTDGILVRFAPSGFVDVAFGTNGVANIIPPTGMAGGKCLAVAEQKLMSNSVYIVSGTNMPDPTVNFIVTKVNSTNGNIINTITNPNGRSPRGIAVKNNGSYIVVGDNLDSSAFHIAFFNANNTLQKFVNTPSGQDIYDIILANDKNSTNFYVAGTPSGTNPKIACYKSNGTLDVNFNNQGFRIIDQDNSVSPKLTLTNDGNIAVTSSNGSIFPLTILNPDGSIRAAITEPMGDSADITTSPKNNNIYIAGTANNKFLIARYIDRGPIPITPSSAIARAIDQLYTLCPIN